MAQNSSSLDGFYGYSGLVLCKLLKGHVYIPYILDTNPTTVLWNDTGEVTTEVVCCADGTYRKLFVGHGFTPVRARGAFYISGEIIFQHNSQATAVVNISGVFFGQTKSTEPLPKLYQLYITQDPKKYCINDAVSEISGTIYTHKYVGKKTVPRDAKNVYAFLCQCAQAQNQLIGKKVSAAVRFRCFLRRICRCF